MVLDLHRLGDRLEHPLRHGARLLRPAQVFQQHGELVAAHAKDEVALAHRPADAFGRDAQQPVAGVVSEAVVYPLEEVEVEEQDGERRTRALRARERLGELAREAGAVRKRGDRVVEGLVAHRLFLRLALALLFREAALKMREQELHHQPYERHGAQHALR